MGNSWDEMRGGKEHAYFDAKNKEALARIRGQTREFESPATGEPMERITHMGINLERCPTTGGIWLDAEEIQFLEAMVRDVAGSKVSPWVHDFFQPLIDNKK